MTVFDDATNLVRHAEKELPQIRAAYERSLHAKVVETTLLIEIKNFCENLRSALDFSACGLFEKFGSAQKGKPKVYFPYATANQNRDEYIKSGRIEKCIPGITASRPDVVALLLELQHFGGRGNGWLPQFMELNNQNKHQRLTPQVRREAKELRISGGGAAISVGQGASISIGVGASISIGGAVIRGGQSFGVDRPPVVEGGKSEVITWVSFHFEDNGQPVIPFLETALKGCREIVTELAKT